MSRRTGLIILAILTLVGAALILMRVSSTPDRPAVPTATVTRLLPTATASPAPISSAAPAPTATPVPKPDIGVQGQFIGPDGDQGIQSAANLGVGWIKQQIDWNSIEY
jgi:hypothetical protein